MTATYDKIDGIFYSDGYRLAESLLSRHCNEESLDELNLGIYHAMDSLIDTLSSRVCLEGQPIHCGKGCHWCCSKQIFSNPWEVIHLSRYIWENFPEKKVQEIIVELRNKNEITAGLNLEEQLSLIHFCALLRERICDAYKARPMACRIYLSMDLNSCIKEYNDPANPEIFASLLEFPLHAGRMMNEGVAGWLREKGLQTREFTLESGLLMVLEQPEVAGKWLSGEKVFPVQEYNETELQVLNSYLLKDK